MSSNDIFISFSKKEFCDTFESECCDSLRKALKNKVFVSRGVPRYQYVIQEVLGTKYNFVIPWNSSAEATSEAKSLRNNFEALDKIIVTNRKRGRAYSYGLDESAVFFSSSLYPALFTPLPPPSTKPSTSRSDNLRYYTNLDFSQISTSNHNFSYSNPPF